MKTFMYTINLKDNPEIINSYKKYHENIWPEVEESLKNIGIINMRIYLLGTRMVNLIETIDDFDPARDLARYAENNPIVEKWDRMMAEFQHRVPEARDGEWWALMEKVYELGKESTDETF